MPRRQRSKNPRRPGEARDNRHAADAGSGLDKIARMTEEEMLNRYQMMHDDAAVDTELILETIVYISKSSYLDGAVLVFLPGM